MPNGIGISIPFAANTYKSKVYEGYFLDGEMYPPYRIIDGAYNGKYGMVQLHL